MTLSETAVGGFLETLAALEDQFEVHDPQVDRLRGFVCQLRLIKTGTELHELLKGLTLELTNRFNSPLIDGLYAGYYGIRPTPGAIQPPEAKPLWGSDTDEVEELKSGNKKAERKVDLPTRNIGFFEEKLTKRLLKIGPYPDALKYLLSQFRLPGLDYIYDAVLFQQNLAVLLTWKEKTGMPLYTWYMLKMLLSKACRLGAVETQKYLCQVIRDRGFRKELIPQSVLANDFPVINPVSLLPLLEEVEAHTPPAKRWKFPWARRQGYSSVSSQAWKVVLDFVGSSDPVIKKSRRGLEDWLLMIFEEGCNPTLENLSLFLDRLKIPQDVLDRILTRAAGSKRNLATVKLLIEKGANHSAAVDDIDETPLGTALISGDPEVVAFLLQAGVEFPEWVLTSFTEWAEANKLSTGLAEKLYILYRHSVRVGRHKAYLQGPVFARKLASFYVQHLMEISTLSRESTGLHIHKTQEQGCSLLRSQITELRRCVEFLFQAKAVYSDGPLEWEAKVPFPSEPMDPDLFNVLVREALDWDRELVQESDPSMEDQLLFGLKLGKYSTETLRFLTEPPWVARE